MRTPDCFRCIKAGNRCRAVKRMSRSATAGRAPEETTRLCVLRSPFVAWLSRPSPEAKALAFPETLAKVLPASAPTCFHFAEYVGNASARLGAAVSATRFGRLRYLEQEADKHWLYQVVEVTA